MVQIYILKLQKSKYYVGKTNNLEQRLANHFNGEGSAWTKKYKPLELVESFDDCDDFDEDKYTLKYMSIYGISNVRGGSFSTVELSRENRNMIEKMINSTLDRCLECGATDHFISSCPNQTRFCWRCKRYGHTSLQCYAKKTIYGTSIGNNCYRCGSDDHWRITCTAEKDLDGRILDSDVGIGIINGAIAVFKKLF